MSLAAAQGLEHSDKAAMVMGSLGEDAGWRALSLWLVFTFQLSISVLNVVSGCYPVIYLHVSYLVAALTGWKLARVFTKDVKEEEQQEEPGDK